MLKFLVFSLLFPTLVIAVSNSAANAMPKKIELSFETARPDHCTNMRTIHFVGKTVLLEDSSSRCFGVDTGIPDAGNEFRLNGKLTVERSCVHETNERSCDDGTQIRSPGRWTRGTSTEVIIATSSFSDGTLKLKYQSEVDFVRVNRKNKVDFDTVIFYEIKIGRNSCELVNFLENERFRGRNVLNAKLEKVAYCRLSP
jgi:hypothetical protein